MQPYAIAYYNRSTVEKIKLFSLFDFRNELGFWTKLDLFHTTEDLMKEMNSQWNNGGNNEVKLMYKWDQETKSYIVCNTEEYWYKWDWKK